MPRGKVMSPKTQIQEMLAELPSNASYEDIQYRIYMMAKVEKGRKDIREGRTLSQMKLRGAWPNGLKHESKR